jgi:hypothetical protein
MHRIKRRTVAIAAGTIVVLAASGTAYAFWTASGTGTGVGTTTAGVAVTVNQTVTLTAMYPGDAAQTLSGDFNNAGATTHVNSVMVSISGVTGGAGSCSAADYGLTGATMAAVQDVPNGTAVGSWTGATIQFHDTTANQDGCKGATVDLAYVTA